MKLVIYRDFSRCDRMSFYARLPGEARAITLTWIGASEWRWASPIMAGWRIVLNRELPQIGCGS